MVADAAQRLVKAEMVLGISRGRAFRFDRIDRVVGGEAGEIEDARRLWCGGPEQRR